jgi:hypothetical protein
MAENLLYHAHGDTLNEQECCAGVSRIVEPLSRQTGRLQSALVAAGYRRGVQRRPNRTREDEVTILPGWPCGDPFLKLSAAVLAQRSHDRTWHCQRSSAFLGLRFYKLDFGSEPLERVANR